MLVGCSSSSTPVAENDSASQGAGQATAPAATTSTDMTPAINVVSQFLDALRRGGSDTEALSLVTTAAREEFRRTGLVMQPIGSPDAKFQVTRSQLVPSQAGAALVHSTWTEPVGDGTTSTSEVVWAVQQQDNAWKISGMVIGQATGEPPVVVDFENGDDLIAKFRPQSSSTEPQALQAAAPTDSSVPAGAQPPVIR